MESRTDRSTSIAQFGVWVAGEAAFNTKRITPIHHNFHEHPLMQIEQLSDLAKELMVTEQCRFVSPGITPESPFRHSSKPHNNQSIDEVFQRIKEPGSWVALYDIQTVPRYKHFLREVMDSARPLVEPQQPGIFNICGFIFISAPPSVTPFHIDRENNFWLQIRGEKVINVWDHTDRTLVQASDVEGFICYGGLETVKLKPGFIERSREFVTRAGDGVYFPSTSPHMTRSDTKWVPDGNEISISIGVVFYTDVTRREAVAHALNKVLRRFGGKPTYPGESPWLDRLKYPVGKTLLWIQRHFRGYQPKPGL